MTKIDVPFSVLDTLGRKAGGGTEFVLGCRHAGRGRMFPRSWLRLLEIPSIPKITKSATNPVHQSQEKHTQVKHNVWLKERDFH